MNPFDAIGTARISSAVYDRVCRLSVGYQDAADEVVIVRRALPAIAVDDAWLAAVVEVVRRTRTHPDIRIGSSVRGAIDCAAVAASLASLRGVSADNDAVGLDSALVALSGRLRLREGSGRSAEAIVTELWQQVFAPPKKDGEGGAGKASAPTGANQG
ncbi:MAG: MoxR family ATPase, partial [Ilumatobacteraceae bacterium]|nr:MoxR family ATPase [Ilumatobacteraceae bacterium]